MKEKLDFSSFERSLNEEKVRMLSSLDSIKREVNMMALEDEIDDIEDMADLQIQNTKDQKIIAHLESELFEIEAALARIKNGTYGICEKTGKNIPIERLKANPMARTIAIV